MLTLTQLGEAEQTINKSRFIARAVRCENERELAFFLRKLAAEHANASHLAYAFRIKAEQGIVQRFSDAGEPSGTAGKPILQFLEGRNLIQVGVGVIRYYGGINLGTGGLARAYGGTAKMALEAAGLCEYVEMQLLKWVLDYKQLDYFVRELGKVGGELLQKNFNDKVEVIARLPTAQVAKICQKFNL